MILTDSFDFLPEAALWLLCLSRALVGLGEGAMLQHAARITSEIGGGYKSLANQSSALLKKKACQRLYWKRYGKYRHALAMKRTSVCCFAGLGVPAVGASLGREQQKTMNLDTSKWHDSIHPNRSPGTLPDSRRSSGTSTAGDHSKCNAGFFFSWAVRQNKSKLLAEGVVYLHVFMTTNLLISP